jgi:membrane protease YdiL (CAAX protease family)
LAVLIVALIVLRREGYKLTLRGNYLFFAVFVVYGIVFNIIGEELYYRSVLLPKMRGVFGKWELCAVVVGAPFLCK